MNSRYVQGLAAVAHLQRGGKLSRRCPICEFELILNREGFAWSVVDGEHCQISHLDLLRECLCYQWEIA